MEKFRKVFYVFLIAVYSLTTPSTFVFAKEVNEKNKTAKESVSVGKLEESGDIKVTKTVKPTDTVGKYTVTFEIEGKPAEKQKNYPIYAAVVFDRSGSMICDSSKGGYSYMFDTYENWPNNQQDSNHMTYFNQNEYWDSWSMSTKTVSRVTDPTYTAADDSKILCGYAHEYSGFSAGSWQSGEYFDQKDDSLLKDKWESAVQGAIDFSTTLKNQVGDSAHFSLITFASTASSATAFSNNTFNSSDFGTPYGGTDLAAALNSANSALSSAPANSKKVILVISDGEPDDANGAQRAVNKISKDVEIYAIGYSTSVAAKNFLKNTIASKADNYSDADPETVSAKMKELAMEINRLAAGTGVSLSDTLTGEFSFNSTNFTTDKDTSFELKDIASDDTTLKQTVSFDIYIDTDLPTGVYDTNDIANDQVKLTYTDPEGNQKDLVFDESPSVEWVQPTYTVNYYKDEIKDSNKLGDSVVKDGKYNKTVSLDDSELNLRKPKGYKVQDGQTSSILIDKDSSKNVINVLYVKDSFNYSLKYYKDDMTDENKIGDDDVRTATFEQVVTVNTNDKNARMPLGYRFDSVTPTELSISDDESKNVFSILYVKDNFEYTVNYYKDEIKDSNKIGDSVTKSAQYQSNVTLSNDDKNLRKPEGYKLGSVDPETLSISTEGNVINVLYVKDNFDYTINYYKDEITDSNKIGDSVTKSAEYQSDVTLDDDEKNLRKPEGYKLDSVDPETLSISTEGNVINVLYVKDSFDYTINYYKDEIKDSNKIGDSVTKSAQYQSDVTLDDDEKNLRKPDGYRLGSVDPETLSISTEGNVINVLYVKDDFNYSLRYYKDSIKDENKIGGDDVRTATFEQVVTVNNNDKNARMPLGYRFDSITPSELKVSSDASKNIFDILYVRDDFDYTINYYKDEIKDSNKIGDSVTKSAEYQSDVTLDDDEKNLRKPEGYKLDSVNPETLNISTEGNVINVLYVKDSFDYTVNYYKDEIKDSNKIGDSVTKSAEYQSDVTLDDDEKNLRKPEGYKLDSVDPETLNISTEGNVINVLYVKDSFDYTVNYYKDSISDSNKLGDSVTNSAEYQSDVILTDDEKNLRKPEGYKLDSVNPETLSVSTEGNVINVLYVKDEFNYSLKYYKDNVADENKIGDDDVRKAKFEEIVTVNTNDKNARVPLGYRFDSVTPDELTISSDESKNVFSILYVRDNFDYAVRYYKDTIDDSNKLGDDVVKSAQYQSDVTLTDDEKNLRMPKGYKLDNVIPNTLVISTEENVINVLYVKDSFDYVINYYKDDVTEDNKIDSVTGNAEYETVINLTEDDLYERLPDGYMVQDNQPISLTISDDTDENVINIVYVKRNDLSYRVEYYFDGNIDDELTVVKNNQEFGKQISEYENKVKDGYKFEKTENLPLTITTGENVIKVYYVTDNASKEEATAIPQTGVIVSGSGDLFILLSLLFVLYLRGRRIFD